LQQLARLVAKQFSQTMRVLVRRELCFAAHAMRRKGHGESAPFSLGRYA
jgi:hypothetical protein